jgi:hypothetical protein
MANIGGRPGGAITAGCFLSRFTRKYNWAPERQAVPAMSRCAQLYLRVKRDRKQPAVIAPPGRDHRRLLPVALHPQVQLGAPRHRRHRLAFRQSQRRL